MYEKPTKNERLMKTADNRGIKERTHFLGTMAVVLIVTGVLLLVVFTYVHVYAGPTVVLATILVVAVLVLLMLAFRWHDQREDRAIRLIRQLGPAVNSMVRYQAQAEAERQRQQYRVVGNRAREADKLERQQTLIETRQAGQGFEFDDDDNYADIDTGDFREVE